MELIKRYKAMPITIKATFWFMICGFMQNAVATITTPVFTRIMSTEEYGEFSVFTSTITLLAVVVTYNIDSSVATKGLSKYPGREEQFLANIQLVSTISTIVCFAIFLITRESLSELLGISSSLIALMFAQMLVMPSFQIWSAAERYHFRYQKILIFTMAYVFCSTFISLCAVFVSENKGQARIVSYCIVNILFWGCLYLWILFRKHHFIHKEMILFTLKFNFPIIFQGLSNQVLARCDLFMINYYLGKTEAGIYSLGYNVAMMITILTTSINNTYVPWLYQKLDKMEYPDIKKRTNQILLGLFATVSLAILVAPEIITLFGPKSYGQASYVVAPVLVGIAFTMVYTVFVNLEVYFEKTFLVMGGSIMVALLNIILNKIFIPQYGFIAAAYTTLVSYILYSIIHYICVKLFCRKLINVNAIYDLKFIAFLSVVQIIILLTVIQLHNYILIRYTVALILFALLAGISIKRKRLFFK